MLLGVYCLFVTFYELMLYVLVNNISVISGLFSGDLSIQLSKVHRYLILFVLLLYIPKSTAMVIAGRSVHLTTLFPGQA